MSSDLIEKISSIFYIFYDLHVKKKTIVFMFICSANTSEFDLFSIYTIYVYENTFLFSCFFINIFLLYLFIFRFYLAIHKYMKVNVSSFHSFPNTLHMYLLYTHLHRLCTVLYSLCFAFAFAFLCLYYDKD